MKPKIAILIPAYNESKTIGTVIQDLNKTEYPFLVVDDGSTDETISILENYKVNYWSLERNKGRGHAVRRGALKLIMQGYTHMLIMDSDGQHLISDIPIFLECLKKHPNIDIIIGNRLLNHSKMPFIRYYTNILMSKVISFIIGQKVSDSQCGMKLVNLFAFTSIPLRCNRFDFDSELLIEANECGFNIKNVPIHTIYNKNRISKINPLSDTIRFIKLLWRYYGRKI
jgi:glycosyltransferase involved in cell wall biosynthesis